MTRVPGEGVLDNPLWSSLTTTHRALAVRAGDLARYPAEVAPFLATDSGSLDRGALDALIAAGERVYLIGDAPAVPAGWRLESLGEIVQMVSEAPVAAPGVAAIVPLGEAERADVLALTTLVYPHYFRPRTTDLGRYFGVYERGRLAAMLGERMGMPGFRELSAICTHPDCVGRGLARALIAFAVEDLRARGTTPFLHVSPSNARARRLYEQNGFVVRRSIAFWQVART